MLFLDYRFEGLGIFFECIIKYDLFGINIGIILGFVLIVKIKVDILIFFISINY